MPHPLTVPAKPWERLHLDFVGGFDQVTINGNVFDHLFTCVDAFTKFAWAIPCNSLPTAKDTALLFLTHIFPMVDHPQVIVADNGPQFAAALMKEFAILMDIDLRYSAAMHAQSNGLA